MEVGGQGGGGGSLSGDGEALVNLQIMSGVRAESCLREGIFEVRRLCSPAPHLYFMLPLRQMKPEPPVTRGGPSDTSKGSPMGFFFFS